MKRRLLKSTYHIISQPSSLTVTRHFTFYYGMIMYNSMLVQGHYIFLDLYIVISYQAKFSIINSSDYQLPTNYGFPLNQHHWWILIFILNVTLRFDGEYCIWWIWHILCEAIFTLEKIKMIVSYNCIVNQNLHIFLICISLQIL